MRMSETAPTLARGVLATVLGALFITTVMGGVTQSRAASEPQSVTQSNTQQGISQVGNLARERTTAGMVEWASPKVNGTAMNS